MPHQLLGLRLAQAADVDAADGDPLGDLIALRRVPRVCGNRPHHEENDGRNDRNERPASHALELV
jgi:hypothetical protein